MYSKFHGLNLSLAENYCLKIIDCIFDKHHNLKMNFSENKILFSTLSLYSKILLKHSSSRLYVLKLKLGGYIVTEVVTS